MILSGLRRFMRILLTSFISSLPYILLQLRIPLNDLVLLSLSILIFIAILGIDCFKFSLYFPPTIDGVIGIWFPYAAYVASSFIVYGFLNVNIFNFIFFPLRFFEMFYTKTIHSVMIVHAIIIIMFLIIRLFGKRRMAEFEQLQQAKQLRQTEQNEE